MTSEEIFAKLGYTKANGIGGSIRYARGSADEGFEIISINMELCYVFKEEIDYFGDAYLKHLTLDETKAAAKAIEEMETSE